jgi:outer membrane protein assembly factor BamB
MPESGKRRFVCEFCGSTLEDQTTPEERETGSYPRLIIHSTASVAPPKPLTPAQRKRAKRVAWFLLLLIIVPLLIGVGVVLFTSGALVIGGEDIAGKIASRRIYGFGVSQLLLGDNTTQPDIVAVARYADETKRLVYVDFEADPPERWVSEPLGGGADYIYNRLSHDQDRIYLAFESNLTALNRTDGRIIWRVDLSDEISTTCQECLQVNEDTIVVLTADGQLAGYDSQTGDLIWENRLNATPRQLMNLAGKVGVLDEGADEVGIQVFEPGLGDLHQSFIPTCPNEVFPNSPQTLGIYDQVFVSSDRTKFFILIHDYDPGCIQVWDAVNLTQIMSKQISDEALDALDWGTYLFTDQVLYTSDQSSLYYINLVDGSNGVLYTKTDFELSPINALPDFVLVIAERTRGTTQYSLLGIDPPTKGEIWEFKPEAGEIYESGTSVVHKEGIWHADTTPGKVTVLEAFSDPAFISTTILNQLDGTTIYKNSLNLDEYETSYWIQILGMHQDQIFLVTSDVLRVIDTTTGVQLYVWP